MSGQFVLVEEFPAQRLYVQHREAAEHVGEFRVWRDYHFYRRKVFAQNFFQVVRSAPASTIRLTTSGKRVSTSWAILGARSAMVSS